MTVGEERLDFLRDQLATLRHQNDNDRSATGITNNRYSRVLNGVEKVLIDHAEEIKGERPWPEIVLWALDILGMDTDEDGWAPHAERAERMGW